MCQEEEEEIGKKEKYNFISNRVLFQQKKKCKNVQSIQTNCSRAMEMEAKKKNMVTREIVNFTQSACFRKYHERRVIFPAVKMC